MDTHEAGLKRTPSHEQPIREPRVGYVVAAGPEGPVHLDFPGNTRGPVAARVSAMLDARTLAHAAEQRQQALLMFERRRPLRTP